MHRRIKLMDVIRAIARIILIIKALKFIFLPWFIN